MMHLPRMGYHANRAGVENGSHDRPCLLQETYRAGYESGPGFPNQQILIKIAHIARGTRRG